MGKIDFRELDPELNLMEQGCVATGPFDLEGVRRRLLRYDGRLDELVSDAKLLAVLDEGGEEEAVSLAGKAKKLAKELDDRRKEITGPAFEFKKAVDGLIKPYIDKLGAVEIGLKGKIKTFRQAQEVARRKAEMEAQKALAAAQAKLDAEAKAAGVDSVQLPAPVMPPAQNVTRTETGAAHTRRSWKFRVVDLGAVPREFLVLDEPKVRQAIRAGIHNIPGLEIYEDEDVTIRS